jgi:hypothetical protein
MMLQMRATRRPFRPRAIGAQAPLPLRRGRARVLSGVGFLREALEKCLSTGHYLSQVLDFIGMVSWLL